MKPSQFFLIAGKLLFALIVATIEVSIVYAAYVSGLEEGSGIYCAYLVSIALLCVDSFALYGYLKENGK